MEDTRPETYYLVDLPYKDKTWIVVDKEKAEGMAHDLHSHYYAVALIEVTDYGKTHCRLYTLYNYDV